ncbi:hypothetical protein DTO063F5_3338 [Paecilomyces variotii]|nr:hypothetical protein DTO063F5_3338 [Paecilomyces variotii]
MSKRSVFTTVTPLPPYITRDTVVETLHNHSEMIELNPLVIKHGCCKPPPVATADEFHCIWYELTDRISYLPGGMVTGKVSYKACFYDLPRGLQTHVYAPAGLDIKEKWSICGNMPGEPREPVELGLANAPREGLYLREDVDMRCNIVMNNFVKRTLKKAHQVLVDRLVVKADIIKEQAGRTSVTHGKSSPQITLGSGGSMYSGYSGHSGAVVSPAASEFCGGQDPRVRHLSTISAAEELQAARLASAYLAPNSMNVAEVPGSPPPGPKPDPSSGSRPVWQDPEQDRNYKQSELMPAPLNQSRLRQQQQAREQERSLYEME